MDPLDDHFGRRLQDVLGRDGEALPVSGLADRMGEVEQALGSIAVGVAAVGRQVGAHALEVERTKQRLDWLGELLQTGCISYNEARRQLGYEEEDDVGRRHGLAGRGRRKKDREAIPPEAAPIASFLRIHRDEAAMRTSVYHRNGTLLREYNDEEETRPIGQILVEDFVPMICSGCGETKGTSLCEECRQDIVNDLVRGLDHE